jgi:Ni,Fe-hydrogenase I large subunit
MSATTVEGELVVRIEREGRRIRSVTVRSTRPLVPARLVEGRTPAAATAIVRALFTVCGRAQGAAAAAAVAAAEGRVPSADARAARETAVRLETIQEYLWRLLIDFPRAMGAAPRPEAVASARERIAALLTQEAAGPAAAGSAAADALIGIAAAQVYGMLPAAWLAQPPAAIPGEWARAGRTLPAALLAQLLDRDPGLGASDVALMPEATPARLREDIVPALDRDEGFARLPSWCGAPVETGALARTRTHPAVAACAAATGHSVATRMVARLVELALLLDDWRRPEAASPWVLDLPLGSGDGMAAVQTARGLLLHRVRLAGGRVAGYRIVAPTEWNCHPAGALARGLAGIEAGDDAECAASAQLVVQALDPCVAHRVEIGHA